MVFFLCFGCFFVTYRNRIGTDITRFYCRFRFFCAPSRGETIETRNAVVDRSADRRGPTVGRERGKKRWKRFVSLTKKDSIGPSADRWRNPSASQFTGHARRLLGFYRVFATSVHDIGFGCRARALGNGCVFDKERFNRSIRWLMVNRTERARYFPLCDVQEKNPRKKDRWPWFHWPIAWWMGKPRKNKTQWNSVNTTTKFTRSMQKKNGQSPKHPTDITLKI